MPDPQPVEAERRERAAIAGEPEARMSLGEHLDELRSRLVRGVAALFIAFLVGWALYEPISDRLLRPFVYAVSRLNEDIAARREAELLADPTRARSESFLESGELRPELRIDARPIATGPLEGFSYAMKIATTFALLVGAPFLLWQMWGFIAAGLYREERRAVLRYLPWSLGLFLGGALFSFVWALPYVLYYLGSAFPVEKLRPEWRVAEYFDLMLTMCLGMGLVFQIPVLMVFAQRLGLIEARTFSHHRPHFMFGAFVLAAVISPPDLYSTAALVVPMWILYEIGLVFGRMLARPRAHARN
jgi:sec-independent protein translocase protein TatC